jgi:hypothetical protein
VQGRPKRDTRRGKQSGRKEAGITKQRERMASKAEKANLGDRGQARKNSKRREIEGKFG